MVGGVKEEDVDCEVAREVLGSVFVGVWYGEGVRGSEYWRWKESYGFCLG